MAICTSQSNGQWSEVARWDNVPALNDTVIIAAGHDIELDQDYDIGAGGTLTIGVGSSLLVNATRTLSNALNMACGVSVSNENNGTIDAIGGTETWATNNGTITLNNGTVSTNTGTITTNAGTITACTGTVVNQTAGTTSGTSCIFTGLFSGGTVDATTIRFNGTSAITGGTLTPTTAYWNSTGDMDDTAAAVTTSGNWVIQKNFSPTFTDVLSAISMTVQPAIKGLTILCSTAGIAGADYTIDTSLLPSGGGMLIV